MTTLAAKNLSVKIANTNVCDDLNFAIKPGQCWGILGGNGVGKTTLLHTLAGLRPAASGEILVDNEPIESLTPKYRANKIGVLFQDSVDPFPTTVLESVLIGRHPHLNHWQWESETDYELAKSALSDVGLGDFCTRRVDTLSGGERRRLEIATVMVQDPHVYLLDEPSNHLDLRHQMELLSQLVQLTKQNSKSLVMILHDINLASRFCDHLLLLFGKGETKCGSLEEMLDTHLLGTLYGHQLKELSAGSHRVFIPV